MYWCLSTIALDKHHFKFSQAEALFCVQEEAVAYYTKQEAQLRDEYRNERERVKKKPLGMAFVTFQNESMTAMYMQSESLPILIHY